MGSGASKGSRAAPPAEPSPSGRLRSRVLGGVSCFGLPPALPEEEGDEGGSAKGSSCAGDDIGGGEISGRSRKLRGTRNRKMPSVSLCDVDQHGDDGERDELGAAGRSVVDAPGSSNSSGGSRSRFGFIPDRIGFRLSRTASLGSSRPRSLSAEAVSVQNGEGNCNIVDSRNENEENSITGMNQSQDSLQNDAIVGNTLASSHARAQAESEDARMRRHNRRVGQLEPLEGSVRFSRTLSVGRLRDRVLRRTSSSAGIFSSALLEDRLESADSGQIGDRRATLGARRRFPPPVGDEVWPDYARNHPYHLTSLSDSSYNTENGNLQQREGSNNDLLEHRSAFLERRRRIRSQVRALQRLGSRFENLSGHERSCILSGQHRTGRCTCRTSNRAVNPNDETGTRASISRIVMLAEALFEVLDEIHQQSVALTSRPSFSSIGSVPAPKEVVEGMPVKAYMRPHKHLNEEAAQCYICLVEYDDGDSMRVLPCNHEFHQTCIDKWLKEIHRVCPLCRGDVCKPEASAGKIR